MGKLLRIIPININSVILLATSFYCLSFVKDADLIATIFAYSLIGLVSIAVLSVIVNYFIIRKRLSFIFIETNLNSIHYSNRPYFLKLELSNLKILSLCQIKVSVCFKNSSFSPLPVILKTTQKKIDLDYQIEFPHFGEWQIESLDYSISDIFGLSSINAQKENNKNYVIKVDPPKIFTPELPLVFSSLIAGDVMNLPQKKMGDYYDLKKYHPSDGVSKIVWKIFARNQTLIARHPEDTALPAGKSLVLYFGDFHQPKLARHCLNYLEQIISKDLQFIFLSSGNKAELTSNLAEARDLILKNVWQKRFNQEQINNLTSILSKQKECREVAVFMAENSPLQSQIIKFCRTKQIKVLFFTNQSQTKKLNKLKQLFFNESIRNKYFESEKLNTKYA